MHVVCFYRDFFGNVHARDLFWRCKPYPIENNGSSVLGEFLYPVQIWGVWSRLLNNRDVRITTFC